MLSSNCANDAIDGRSPILSNLLGASRTKLDVYQLLLFTYSSLLKITMRGTAGGRNQVVVECPCTNAEPETNLSPSA